MGVDRQRAVRTGFDSAARLTPRRRDPAARWAPRSLGPGSTSGVILRCWLGGLRRVPRGLGDAAWDRAECRRPLFGRSTVAPTLRNGRRPEPAAAIAGTAPSTDGEPGSTTAISSRYQSGGVQNCPGWDDATRCRSRPSARSWHRARRPRARQPKIRHPRGEAWSRPTSRPTCPWSTTTALGTEQIRGTRRPRRAEPRWPRRSRPRFSPWPRCWPTPRCGPWSSSTIPWAWGSRRSPCSSRRPS